MSNGGTDRICQNAASADRPRMRSCQALASVLPSPSSGPRSITGQPARRPAPRPAPPTAPWSAVPGADAAAAGSPARAEDPEGSTVLIRPVCTPDARRASDLRWNAGAFPAVGERSAAAHRRDRRRRAVRRGGTGRGSDAADDRFGGVVGAEVLPLELRTGVQVLEHPGHRDVEALGAGLGVAGAVVDLLLDGGLAGVGPVAADRLDVVALWPVEGEGDRPPRPRRVPLDPRVAVVFSLPVHLA